MSATITPTPPSPAATTTTVADTQAAANDSLMSPQFLIGMYGMTIALLTVGAVFLIKDVTPLQGTLAGAVITACLAPLAFYFGSSKGSQNKDTVQAAKEAPVVTPPVVKAGS